MATQHTFTLTIARVDEPVFSGLARSVSVPAREGVMEVLAHHTPFITSLTDGQVVVTDAEGVNSKYDIKNGTIEIANNTVTVLI